MKLHETQIAGNKLVTAYGDGYVEINRERHHGSLVLCSDAVSPWPPADFDALQPEHFATLLTLQPEVVIFGSGTRLRFPHPRLTAALTNAGIGVEVMDNNAACRTYNFLQAEGRQVVAVLLGAPQ